MSEMNENDIKMVDKLMKLMKKHQIDELEVGTLKLKKSIHPAIDETLPAQTKTAEEDEDDLLYYSA